jgi:hypothetical protein
MGHYSINGIRYRGACYEGRYELAYHYVGYQTDCDTDHTLNHVVCLQLAERPKKCKSCIVLSLRIKLYYTESTFYQPLPTALSHAAYWHCVIAQLRNF